MLALISARVEKGIDKAKQEVYMSLESSGITNSQLNQSQHINISTPQKKYTGNSKFINMMFEHFTEKKAAAEQVANLNKLKEKKIYQEDEISNDDEVDDIFVDFSTENQQEDAFSYDDLIFGPVHYETDDISIDSPKTNINDKKVERIQTQEEIYDLKKMEILSKIEEFKILVNSTIKEYNSFTKRNQNKLNQFNDILKNKIAADSENVCTLFECLIDSIDTTIFFTKKAHDKLNLISNLLNNINESFITFTLKENDKKIFKEFFDANSAMINMVTHIIHSCSQDFRKQLGMPTGGIGITLFYHKGFEPDDITEHMAISMKNPIVNCKIIVFSQIAMVNLNCACSNFINTLNKFHIELNRFSPTIFFPTMEFERISEKKKMEKILEGTITPKKIAPKNQESPIISPSPQALTPRNIKKSNYDAYPI